MSGLRPYFFSNPIRFCAWASREKPAIFYSLIIGALGPVGLVVVPPIRRYYGAVQRPAIPLTYPIPKGPRKIPEGYDDPA